MVPLILRLALWESNATLVGDTHQRGGVVKTYESVGDALDDFDDGLLTAAEFASVVRGLPPSAIERPPRTLRQRIQAAIERNREDPEVAALAVCVVLERQLDLGGNGWWNDDPEVLRAIER